MAIDETMQRLALRNTQATWSALISAHWLSRTARNRHAALILPITGPGLIPKGGASGANLLRDGPTGRAAFRAAGCGGWLPAG